MQQFGSWAAGSAPGGRLGPSLAVRQRRIDRTPPGPPTTPQQQQQQQTRRPRPTRPGDNQTINIRDNGTSLSLSQHEVHAGQLTLNVTSTNGNGGADVTVFKPHPGISVSSVYAHIRAQGDPTPAKAEASTRWLTRNVGIYGGAAIQGAGTARDVIALAAGDDTVADLNTVFAPGASVVSSKLHVEGRLSPQLLPAISDTIDTTSSDRFQPAARSRPEATTWCATSATPSTS